MILETASDSIVFTVAPVADLDGGEIFVLDLETGVASENVNALEALPEPGTALLLGFGLSLLAGAKRNRRGTKLR